MAKIQTDKFSCGHGVHLAEGYFVILRWQQKVLKLDDKL